MTIYETKAQDLANEILISDESKNYSYALVNLQAEPDNDQAIADFMRYKSDYETLINSALDILQGTLGISFGGGGGCGGGGGGCCGRR